MSRIIQKLALILLGVILLAASFVSIVSNSIVHAQEGEATPTVDPCGSPTLQSSLGNVNVRSGPGLEYITIGTVSETEVRPVVGRAGFAQWWQIELENALIGWVANEAVTVMGDIAEVPVVDPPALPDGAVPTPGPAWVPPGNSLCPTSESTEGSTTTDSDSPWTLPTNLSRSGASSDPQMAVDSSGLFHVIWKDAVDGFLYVQGNGNEWSEPVVVELPFGTRVYYPDLNETEETPYFVPTLVADLVGNIHAFWIDNEGGLYYSSVAGGEFGTFSSWRTRQNLGASALTLDVGLDGNGTVHLSYIRPLDSANIPPGVYYRQSTNNGGEWSTAVTIYQSRYYHAITAEQTNVDLVTTTSEEATKVFIVWDNRSLGQVFSARSPDGGLTWEEPKRVDRREMEDTAESVNPGQIAIGASGNEVMAVWQAGHDGEICAHYYSYSSDGGENWEPRQQLERPRGCHKTNQFLVNEEGRIILVALVEEVVGTRGHLMAWDGQQWSDPQEQPILTSFQNPESYLEVSFQCHQSLFVAPNSLVVVGCDGNDGKDIWLTRRAVTNVDDWFAAPPVWQPPVVVGSQPGKVASLNLLSDGDGLLHMIWAREGENKIFYSIQNDRFWNEPVAVLQALEGNAEDPVAVLDNNGRILVAWGGSSSGQIYFSSAETSRATAPSDWSPTQVVSEPGLSAHSPTLKVTSSGVIFIAYTVPLNEARGVYLVRSDDNGETWTTATEIFDGVEARWSIVGEPKLALTTDGSFHMLLTHYQNLAEDRPLGIFYSRSEDLSGGWTTPFLVAEQPVISGDLFGFGLSTLHRLWFDESNSGIDIWHDLSVDGGQAWDSPSSATGFGQSGKPRMVTIDAAGRLHVLGIREENLQHWMWEDNQWMIEADASLVTDKEGEIYALGATVATNGNLEVVFAVEGNESTVYHTERPLELPAVLPEAIPEPTITGEPITAVATAVIDEPPTPSPSPTLAPTPTPSNGSSATDGGDNSGLDIALSFLPAVVIVGVAFFFGLRSIRGRR